MPDEKIQISWAQLQQIVPTIPKNGDVFVGYLNSTMDRFAINLTLDRAAAYIAQVAHESGGFRYVRELASGKAYEGRLDLGNTIPGDGVKYKGRGLIQITGKLNYAALSLYLFGDKNKLLQTPGLLEAPQYAVLSAGWYWEVKCKLNEIADHSDDWRIETKIGELNKFQFITYKINGGLTHEDERESYYNKAKEVLNIIQAA
jgi:putative chitinase